MTDSHPSRSSHRTVPSVSERRRSAAGTSLNLHDSEDHRSSIGHAFRTASPTSSTLGGSPILTGDPHHHRAPSLGELHQELEQEQEAQVNRLLQMIRSQQTQLQQLQQQQSSSQPHQTAAIDDSSDERSNSFPSIPPMPPAGSRASISQLSLSSRRPSRPSSQNASPSLRPRASVESWRGPDGLEGFTGTGDSQRSGRDESAFYQTEAAMLSRENQMLRQRIRDLERHIGELTTSSTTQSGSGAATEAAETADPHASTGVGSTNETANKT
ncbi:hypothetical protein ASPWEDRAFT_71673 [Aspergillus wentii DTO 134E9]|uniref:Uncharacterized protein n=1 Tax=Aspergillus wentii DTO 134E9 TaxID=1073089 RepID=A0A1L9RBW3_ASPWE|nr:uncharacterized protein ASPWEDRAFT_71673 [Aspergillus wentii DTO 134E9]KAI9934946.1 hypothetical protein MW887_000567 [Aspergillus wentii]OJJ32388.1 hypothetical protein ASPWEDRAFT_71673 [Aspergillus wentii DTO 134E9]